MAGHTERVIRFVVVAVTILLLVPLAAILVPAAIAAWRQTGAPAAGWERLGLLTLRSTAIAGGAATLATFAGAGLAWVLAARPGLWLRFRVLLLLPLVLPPYLLTLGWVAATDVAALRWGFQPGLSGILWGIAILGLAAAPPAALVLGTFLRRAPVAPIESALLSLGPAGALRTAIIPLWRRPAGAIWLFVFGQTLAEYGVPLYLQTPVLATELVSAFTGGEPAGNVLLASWPLALLLAGTIAAWSSAAAVEGVSRRAPSQPGKLSWLEPASWPGAWRLVTGIGCLVAVVGLAVPVVGLALGAFRPGNGGAGILLAALPALRMSVFLAAGCALLAVIPALVLGDLLTAAPSRLPLVLSALALAIPAGCTGVAHATFWILTPFAGGETAIWCGHLARILPVAWIVAALTRGPTGRLPALDAAILLPGSSLDRFLLRLRLELPRVLSVAGAAFVLSIRELDVSLLTVPPGGETLPLRLFNLMHYGAGADVCRIGLVLGGVLWLATHIVAAHAWPIRKEGT